MSACSWCGQPRGRGRSFVCTNCVPRDGTKGAWLRAREVSWVGRGAADKRPAGGVCAICESHLPEDRERYCRSCVPDRESLGRWSPADSFAQGEILIGFANSSRYLPLDWNYVPRPRPKTSMATLIAETELPRETLREIINERIEYKIKWMTELMSLKPWIGPRWRDRYSAGMNCRRDVYVRELGRSASRVSKLGEYRMRERIEELTPFSVEEFAACLRKGRPTKSNATKRRWLHRELVRVLAILDSGRTRPSRLALATALSCTETMISRLRKETARVNVTESRPISRKEASVSVPDAAVLARLDALASTLARVEETVAWLAARHADSAVVQAAVARTRRDILASPPRLHFAA